MTPTFRRSQALRARRHAISLNLTFAEPGKNPVHLAVTYGIGDDAQVREVFCKPFKLGSDRQTDLRLQVLVMSIALQHGASIAELAHVIGEEDLSKPAQSIIGLIVRAGVTLETSILDDAHAGGKE